MLEPSSSEEEGGSDNETVEDESSEATILSSSVAAAAAASGSGGGSTLELPRSVSVTRSLSPSVAGETLSVASGVSQSRSNSLARPSSPSPSLVSEKDDADRAEREEEERKKRLQLYVFVLRTIAYPFNAKQPTDMTRRQTKITKQQLDTIQARFQVSPHPPVRHRFAPYPHLKLYTLPQKLRSNLVSSPTQEGRERSLFICNLRFCLWLWRRKC